MNILITGSLGFLGRHTARKLKNINNTIYGLGRGKASVDFLKNWGIDFWHESDINLQSISNINIKFDLIVHCGGGSSVGFSNNNPIQDFNNSAYTTLCLLEYVRKSNTNCKFIYPSSPAVLGSFSKRNIKPNKEFKPISSYGFNKQLAEEMCFFYSRKHGIPVGIIRFFSIYGNDLKKQLLWDACNKIKIDSAIFFFSFNETRDWIHVNDAVEIINCFSEKLKKFKIINAGTGIATENRVIIEMINNHFPNDVKIKFNNQIKKGDPQHFCADISSTLNYGWIPKVKIEDGIKDYVLNFIKEND